MSRGQISVPKEATKREASRGYAPTVACQDRAPLKGERGLESPPSAAVMGKQRATCSISATCD